MKTRRTQHSRHVKYLQYDVALALWRKSKALWFRVLNNKDRGKDRATLLENLTNSKSIFTELAACEFLSASSYLEKIRKMYCMLGTKQAYDEALGRLHEADQSKDVYFKRIKYSEAERIFFNLGKFSSSEFYAKKAGLKYLEALKQNSPNPANLSKSQHSFFNSPSTSRNLNFQGRRTVDDESTAQSEFKVLIEDGYDLCLRTQLPALGRELLTTTVITPAGAFQLDAAKKSYVCVLDPTQIKQLGLGSYLIEAKELQYDRRSIKTELTSEQLSPLEQALIASKGRSLQEESEPTRGHFSLM